MLWDAASQLWSKIGVLCVVVSAYQIAEQFRGGSNERATPGHNTLDAKLLMRRDNYEFGIYARNLTDEVLTFERNQQGYVLIYYGRRIAGATN